MHSEVMIIFSVIKFNNASLFVAVLAAAGNPLGV